MTPRYITLRSLRVACRATRIGRYLPSTISRADPAAPSCMTFVYRKPTC